MATGDPQLGTYSFYPNYTYLPNVVYSPPPTGNAVPELLTVEHYDRLIKLLNILAERLTAIEEAVGSGS